MTASLMVVVRPDKRKPRDTEDVTMSHQ
eukprot:COSAG06_NODE_61402_length_268_cov_0.360947_1_plen_27_part_10